jgi:ribosome-associated protein
MGQADHMPEPLRISSRLVVPAAELSWRFSRSSGPGGQGVNTTDSRVEVSLDIAASSSLGPTQKARAVRRLGHRLVDGVLTVTASEHRSQLRNREAALDRLAETLREATAPPPRPRRATKPTKASRERRLTSKRRRGEVKRRRSRPPPDE